jgi:hypothetical protein
MNFRDNFINNFESCYACKNQLLFHESDIRKFLEKYLYKKVNRKMLNMVFRLFPKINEYINFDYYDKFRKIVFDLHFPIKNKEVNSYSFIYQSHFYQDNLNEDSFVECLLCKNKFCPIHLKLICLKTDLCKCNKHLQVCSFCCELFTVDDLCSVLHKKNIIQIIV